MISQLERLFAQLIADGGFVLFPLLGCAALARWGIGARCNSAQSFLQRSAAARAEQHCQWSA